MRLMRWVRFAGLVLGARQGRGRGPQVVHAEVPDFFGPPVDCARAFAARIRGKVTLRVTIDRDGKVTSSTVERYQPFADRCVEEVAKKWVFVTSDQEDLREALLTFWFTGEIEDTDEPSHTISSFDDPWTVRLGFAESTIQWLPRANGGIPEKRCPAHGTVMGVEVVPVWYGLPARLHADDPEEQRKLAVAQVYRNAKEKLFPETNWHDFGGCIVLKPKAEMYYCQACRDAERAWLVSHPGFDPNQ